VSYPRNAASPPRIAVGAVILIADGAVQTSGVSVVVRPEGGAESAGAGTIAYSEASGVVYYTPTQAETNYTAFCVIAYKTACIPAQVTVVPSASSTAGVAELDPAVETKINNIQDAAGWLLAINSGACENPQTSAEQYDITAFGVAFRVVMAGQTATGTRTAPSLSKP
jgi:hypothetical protein